jgi:hypothetical protein
MASSDRQLLQYVKREVRKGSTEIRVPSSLFASASKLAKQDVRELCRVNGIAFLVVAG